jgi:hypothetical protein
MLHVRKEFVIWWVRNGLIDQRDAQDIVVNDQNTYGARPKDTMQLSRTGIALLQSGYLPMSIIYTRFGAILSERSQNIFNKVGAIRNNFVSLMIANKNKTKSNSQPKWSFVDSVPNQSRLLHWNTIGEALHHLDFDLDDNTRIQVLNGNVELLGDFMDKLFGFIAAEDAITRAPVAPPPVVKEQPKQNSTPTSGKEVFTSTTLLTLLRKNQMTKNRNLI